MNAYSICVIIHVQMWCIYSVACWSNLKRFLSILYVFESVFMYFVCLEFCPKRLFHFFQKKNSSRGIFVSNSELSSTRKNEDGKFQNTLNFRQRVSQLSHEQELPAKIVLCFGGHFASKLREKLTCEKCESAAFKGKQWQFFQTSSFCLLHASLNPKHIFSQKLTQNSRSISHKTHLRHVSTSFYFWILRF